MPFPPWEISFIVDSDLPGLAHSFARATGMLEARSSSFAEECPHAQESAGGGRRPLFDDAVEETSGIGRDERRHVFQRPGSAVGVGGVRLQRIDHRSTD